MLRDHNILPIDFDHLLLADTMATSLSLKIVLWVPVTVVNDDSVGRRQVDTQTSSFRTKKENKSI